jgi:hypothetical protein
MSGQPHRHENPHAGQGAVLLDIGGDVGALVVQMPESLVDEEVEVRAVGLDAPDHHPHVAVVARPTRHGTLPSLVYPGLAAGVYDLCRRPTGPVALTVSVRGGEVTSARWPSAAS